MPVASVRMKLLANLLFTFTVLLLVMFHYGNCSKPSVQRNVNVTHIYTLMSSDDKSLDNNNVSCELIYQDYLNMIDNFTRCELKYASPFRLCISCTQQYEVTKAVYANLTQEPQHVYCKIKYMQSDKVQIIPTVQANMDCIWNKAHCQNCYSYEPNGLEPGRVTYRPDVTKFLELHENFTNCVNITDQDNDVTDWTNDGNTTSTCKTCGRDYTLLNDHYNSMYRLDSGDVCMDVMYKMNNSRILWSSHLKCNHREGDRDALPVIIISCIVACTPILFYVSLKVTGKVGQKKIFTQKRLGGSQGTSGDSRARPGSSRGARGNSALTKRRYTTAD